MQKPRRKIRIKRPMESGPKTSWEKVSGWYGEYMGKEGGDYQRDLVFPNAERLLKPNKQGHYLDIACGQGAFSKLIAKHAKSVEGFDASSTLIELAKLGTPSHVHFRVADATNFAHLYPPSSFDGAVCNLAIQNIDKLGPVFENASRVLKSGGTLIITLNHPAYRQPRQSGWGWDEERKLQYRRIDKYMGEYEMPIIAHPGSAPHLKTYSYHRPISVYINELAKHGFMIDAFDELCSQKHSDSGPKAKAENMARKEIPLFLAIRAVKK